MQGDVWKTDAEWFKPWFNTKAYHVLYGHRSESEASDLVSRLMNQGGIGAGGRALDAGCGAGRHARAMAKHGWQVDAFDLSEESIREARRRGDAHIQFRCLDLRLLREVEEWHSRFDLVTNFFTSLGYFDLDESHEAVVEGFSQVLKPGGRVLIDFLNVPQVRTNLVEHEITERENMSFHIHRRIHKGWIEKSIQFAMGGENHHHVERVRALERHDLEALLNKHGFTILKTWGDYNLNAWTASSPRCMILAERPKSQP